MEFETDRLIERLHRLLVVLEDDCEHRRLELPPLAVYDVRSARWLLAAGVPLDRLRTCPSFDEETAEYLIVAGSEVIRVCSGDSGVLLAAFADHARSLASPLRNSQPATAP